jgi:DNA-directed RNA polymerase subunit N (RpoN/RPB10)
MVDLLVPFRSRHLYHPEMEGSASLKSVLPAFVPDLTYEGLAISNGEMASITYNRYFRGLVPEEDKQQIFDDLREYCKLDTLAEVRLVEVLYSFV